MHRNLSPLKPTRPLALHDLACMIVVRNERLRLPDVLRHHRDIGITRFLIVDNGSNDGTTQYLLTEPDVDLWHTDKSFSEALAGVSWHNELSGIYGQDRWYLVIDADELFVYAEMESIGLSSFCQKLTDRGIVAVRAPMVDMYPQGNIFDCPYAPGDNLISTFPYFDGSSYRYCRTRNGGLALTGGPRARIISSNNENFRMCLRNTR